MDLFQIIKNAPIDQVIGDNLVIAFSKVNGGYKNILCSISGGWDSDEVLHIVQMVDIEKKVRYIWFNTGLEYDATKEHIKMLEEKYGIVIEEFKAKKPIPVCCKEYGQPFMSKQISEYIQRLQKHSFQWENEPFEVLLRKYPKCKVALRWWCNEFGEGSRFNISAKRWLKEYMLENPPKFRISNKCCEYAKKLVAADAKRQLNCDLNIIGVRKAEGGGESNCI